MILRSFVGVAAVAALASCGHRPTTVSRSTRCDAAARDAYRIGEGDDASPRKQQILAALASACEQDGWSDEVRACLARTTAIKDDACTARFTEDQHTRLERAFEVGKDSGEPAPAPAPAPAPSAAATPACTAAANSSAETIARDSQVAPEGRAALLAKVRAAILEPCAAGLIPADLLKCLTENDEHFGICGFGGVPGWDAVTASLEAHGFSPSKP